jgi:beta-lactamase class A
LLAFVFLVLPGSRRLPGEEPAAPRVAEELERSIRVILQDSGAEAETVAVAVAVCDLQTGERVLIRADERFHAASTMKVPVMMEVFRRVEDGTLSLDDRLTIRNQFVSIADGSRFVLDPADDSETALYTHVGEERTVGELVRPMITESSNLATNLLVERVTAAKVSELMRALGAEEVRVLRGVEDDRAYARGLNNEVTARGLSTILQRLAERKVVSPGASEQMLTVLRGQKFNEGIPAGLPRGVAVAHKTGSFKGVYHDAAVVEPRGRAPYVLVLLTRGIEEAPRAHELVARVSRAVYEHAMKR